MPVYATPADLAAWTGTEAPDNADQLLRSAARMVRRATVTAVYRADPATDLPRDTDLVDAFRDATTAQAAAWIGLGVDPSAGPAGAAASQVAASGIGGANVQYATSVTADDARRAAVTTLTPEAADILEAAGLLHGPVAAV